MDPATREQVELMKPRRGAVFLLIPLFSVFAVIGIYIVAFGVGIYGRPADGERVTLAWSGCEQAKAVVQHRAEHMGLGDPVFTDQPDGFQLEATLPADPDVAAGIPATLIRPGVLSSHPEGNPGRILLTNVHIESASIRQDITLSPWTVLTLTQPGLELLQGFVREVRDGKIVYTLDEEPIGTVSNLKGAALEVELTPKAPTERARMALAAERMIVLDSGPLPCTLTVR